MTRLYPYVSNKDIDDKVLQGATKTADTMQFNTKYVVTTFTQEQAPQLPRDTNPKHARTAANAEDGARRQTSSWHGSSVL
ncbi:hypothetical protein PspLS_06224 [Pyricularia sp. CBS 133598]|nr:hypothetical protein PspLS_06224 [Pyricularia sp. CBS 133598]